MELSCFNSYDIRGEIGENFNEDIVYRIARSVAQHLNAKYVVISFDARNQFPFASSAIKGVRDSGACAIMIGMAGTEEMYCAVNEFRACAGIAITASHNPINFNGMKIVKSMAQPMDYDLDTLAIKKLAESKNWNQSSDIGQIEYKISEAKDLYVDRVLKFINISNFKSLKIVVDCGHGAAGPTFHKIASKLKLLGSNLDFLPIHDIPDHTFPNGVPNPMLYKNRHITSKKVKQYSADLGVSFDGDFDRCFYDEFGNFVPVEQIVSLLASFFLKKELGSKIVHDTRVIWHLKEQILKNNGVSVQAKTGQPSIKAAMKKNSAIYAGELSSHHYFRDFNFCDSGMIPWLLIVELLSNSNCSLSELIKSQEQKFISSGELNFKLHDTQKAISQLIDIYKNDAVIDRFDGLSFSFSSWRFNIRQSNTEPLIRLNVEIKVGLEDLEARVNEISAILSSF